MTLRTERPGARRCEVTESPSPSSDYADAFEVTVDETDARTAEEVVRTGLSRVAPERFSALILAHRHILGFRLGPASSQDHVMGWRVVMSEPGVCRLEADGPLMGGTMVARRVDPVTMRLTTFVRYRQPLARLVWAIAGPIHRRAAPQLMELSATP
ncbi:hypothetical protein ACIA48_23810 [Mycobacterium sp. NPDC051804]|uniref:hypothetical protein n=1 Tax=Mycobacterium sp. NPDC051804 TaxID=3364295 RepID=UPI00378B6BDA